MVAILVIVFAFSKDKIKILSFLIFFAFSTYIATIIKALLGDPRPFWVDPNIKELDWICYKEYGNPSTNYNIIFRWTFLSRIHAL